MNKQTDNLNKKHTFKLWKKDWIVFPFTILIIAPILIWGLFLVVLETVIGLILRKRFSI